MKLIIESEPKEIAALVAELQEQQRPIILPGVGIEKFLQENPDFIKEAEPLARDA